MPTTSDGIVDAMGETKKHIHSEYGIHGVTETFTINSKNVFRYKYQFHGRKQWFCDINKQRGGVSTRNRQVTP